jgi:hypothetical protein
VPDPQPDAAGAMAFAASIALLAFLLLRWIWGLF